MTCVPEFDSEAELLQFLQQSLEPFPGELRTHPDASSFASQFQVHSGDDALPPKRIGQRRFIVRRLKWVIQEDDLALFKSIAGGVKAAAAAGFFATAAAAAQASVMGAVAGIVFALATLVRSAWKKGAILESDESTVLSLLVTAGRPLPPAQIAQALAREQPAGGWDDARATAALARLEKVRLADGSVKAFVASDHEGKWGAVDVRHIL
jgi:hypothetical protein